MSQEKPRDHNELFLVLKRTLNPEALEDMKLVVRAPEFGGFLHAELEKIKNVRDMLLELEVRGVIGVGKYMKLKEIMRSIGYVAVLEDIAQTEKLLSEKGYDIESEASNTEMTSKRVSQPHEPLVDSSGYAPTASRADNKMQSSEHETTFDASDIDKKMLRVLAKNIGNDRKKLATFLGVKAAQTASYQLKAPFDVEEQDFQMLLDWFRKQTNHKAAKGVLKEVFSERGRADLVKIISGETAEVMVTDVPIQAVDKFEKILRNRYKTTGSFVQIVPWVGDDMKPISDIYTKLELQKTAYQVKTLKSYEEFFLEKNEGHLIRRIILEGKPGIGKSTLVDKMAYDWAKGEKLHEYKLVFVLKMFALGESSEFIDAIFHQLIDKDKEISKDDLMSYITTNPAKVLILFDGFDEFKTTIVSEMSKSSGYVSQILNRKILRDSWVVVTTRPSHFSKLVSKSLIEKPFVRVLVQGFNGEDIEQYIHSFFFNEPDEAEEGDRAERLIQKTKSSHVLLNLAKCPMLLLLICVLWREQSTIPDTIYRLYKDALRYIFKRKQLQPDETAQVVITIGKNALDDLLSPHQFFSFKEGDFEEQALRSALKAGILTSQRVVKGLDTRHSVSFIHRTFQEYCAAIFFQSLLRTDEEQFNLNLDRVGNIMKDSPKVLEYLLRFCCGDNQACTNKVLSLIQKYPMKSIVLSIMCYFEGQFEDLPSVVLITHYLYMYMSIEEYSTDEFRALFYYLKRVNADDKKKGRETAKLSKVKGLSISSCNLESFGEDLGKVMSGMTNLSSFKLDKCEVTPVCMEYIASSFVSTPKLTKLDIEMERDVVQSIGHSVGLLSWGHNLRSLTLLERFTFKGCDLQHKDLKYIAASLGLMKNLIHCEICIDNQSTNFLSCVNKDLCMPPLTDFLHVCSCSLTSSELSLTAPHLCSCSLTSSELSLTALHVHSCSLTSSELSDILSGLKTREDTFSINLSGNPLLGGLANIWAEFLNDLKHLKELHLLDCALESKDIEPLAGSLSDMSTLSTLDLTGNPSLGGNAASWAVHLGQLNPLEEMSLGNCSMRSVDIEPIAKSVGNIGTLDLSGNKELGHSLASWTPSLRHFKHVKKIYLTSCGLSFEDKTLISKVQQEMSNNVEIEWVESPPPHFIRPQISRQPRQPWRPRQPWPPVPL